MVKKHELPALPYPLNALEPYMDTKTVEIHWGKHHRIYVDKLNAALDKHPELFDKSVSDLLKDLNAVPEDIRTAVRNFGGGHANHSLFWEIMAARKTECKGKVLDKIKKDFGSFDEFKKQFTDKATTLFGSGYCWLVVANGKLEIVTTKDQDSPISVGKKPILVIDVWEHSYYICYMWNRVAYVEAWWNLVNWDKVEELFSGN